MSHCRSVAGENIDLLYSKGWCRTVVVSLEKNRLTIYSKGWCRSVAVSLEKTQTYAYGYLGQGTVVVSYCRSVAAENTDITCICMLRTRECRTVAEEHKYFSL